MLVELPVPKIPYHKSLEQTQISILKSIAKKNGRTVNKMITRGTKDESSNNQLSCKRATKKKINCH